MSIGAITNMLSYLPQPVGSLAGVAGGFFGGGSAPAVSPPTTSSLPPAATTQLSSVGSLISQLQQLVQSNPAKFAKVTAAIASKLQGAAGKVGANGDTTLANKLSAAAQEFQTASQTGQMPSLSNLQAIFSGGIGNPAQSLAAAYQNASQSSMHVLSAMMSHMPASII